MSKNSSALIKKLQSEMESYQGLQKNCIKFGKQRTLLESQLNENKCVLEELNLVKSGNNVYKLYGPILVKQDLEESRQNVSKRIEFILKELENSGKVLEDMENEMAKLRLNVQNLQQQYKLAVALN